jgi:general stress protein 26
VLDTSTECVTGRAARDKCRELLVYFEFAIFLSFDRGELDARPMGLEAPVATFDGSLWFFTDDRAHKVREIRADSSASVVMQNDRASAYLHLSGSARPVRDRRMIWSLLTPRQRRWFPRGADDPHLLLLEFTARGGAFWAPDGTTGVLQFSRDHPRCARCERPATDSM